MDLRPKSLSSAADGSSASVIDVHAHTGVIVSLERMHVTALCHDVVMFSFVWARFTPAGSLRFLFSPRLQCERSSLTSSDLLISMSIALMWFSQTVLKRRWDWPFSCGQFHIQQELRNLQSLDSCFQCFCRPSEAKIECPVQSALLHRILWEIGGFPTTRHR